MGEIGIYTQREENSFAAVQGRKVLSFPGVRVNGDIDFEKSSAPSGVPLSGCLSHCAGRIKASVSFTRGIIILPPLPYVREGGGDGEGEGRGRGALTHSLASYPPFPRPSSCILQYKCFKIRGKQLAGTGPPSNTTFRRRNLNL
jgi:hypothetical protein